MSFSAACQAPWGGGESLVVARILAAWLLWCPLHAVQGMPADPQVQAITVPLECWQHVVI